MLLFIKKGGICLLVGQSVGLSIPLVSYIRMITRQRFDIGFSDLVQASK